MGALDLHRSLTQYAHRIWGQEEGLFQPTIFSILQTRDGFLWLGTQDSLIRFDGVHFREFAGGASVLHGSTIRSLVEDGEGNVWAGTLGVGVVRIAPDGSVRQFSTHNGLPGDTIFCLAADGANAVWACTVDGLVHIDKSGQIRTFTHADGLPFDRVRTLCRAPDGRLWIAGLDGGLASGVAGRFAPAPLPASVRIAVLACDPDGSLWAGTSAGLLHVQGPHRQLFTTREGLPDNDVSALIESGDGTLWIGTRDGISRWRKGEISVYRTRDGLSHSEVLSLCLDREGSLWAGTKNGLDQFTDGNVTPYTTNQGLLSNNVGPVLEDAGGRLWIGTLDKGLNWFDGRRFQSLTRADGLPDNRVLSLARDPAGDLWVGTESGVARVHEGRVIAVYHASQGLLNEQVRALYVDAQNTLWAGTGRGLALLRAHSGRFVSAAPPGQAQAHAVLALSAGRTVQLFAALDDPALYLLRNGSLSLRLLDTTHAADAFLHDPERRTLWMGTLGSGLLRWKDNRIAHVYVRDGLYDNRIYGILQDGRRDLWFASSKGIFRIAEQQLDDFADGRGKNIRSLPFSTGQLRFECRDGVQPAACRMHDGRLWFATTTGLVMLDPGHLARNQVPPPARITALLANGKLVSGEPDLRPGGADNLEIRYAGLSFISPEKVTFRYKLEGYDRDWIDAGERRAAFYTNLPPREFRFVVEARNVDGVWSRRPASVRFTILPKLYQRAWFWPVLAAALALLIFAVVRIRIRRLRRRFAAVLGERSRIARELHDTLLQGLSGLTMQLQALRTRLPASPEKHWLGEIIADAARCSSEARQSLWGLRSPQSGSSDFSRKLTGMVRQMVAGKPIALSLAIQPLSLAELPDAEYQLLRIAQEAIANAIRHAEASRLIVILQQIGESVRLTIEDNGAGMPDPLLHVPGHFGLQGMRERAAEIGARLTFESSPQAGTRVLVCLDTQRKLSAESNPQASEVHQL